MSARRWQRRSRGSSLLVQSHDLLHEADEPIMRGFLGRALAKELLARDCDVVVLTRSPRARDDAGQIVCGIIVARHIGGVPDPDARQGGGGQQHHGIFRRKTRQIFVDRQ